MSGAHAASAVIAAMKKSDGQPPDSRMLLAALLGIALLIISMLVVDFILEGV